MHKSAVKDFLFIFLIRKLSGPEINVHNPMYFTTDTFNCKPTKIYVNGVGLGLVTRSVNDTE